MMKLVIKISYLLISCYSLSIILIHLVFDNDNGDNHPKMPPETPLINPFPLIFALYIFIFIIALFVDM